MNAKLFCSRRNFLSASLAAGGTLAGGTHREPFFAGNPDSGRQSATTVIHKVFLAKPVPSWPRPDIDLQAEIKEIEAQLSTMRQRWDRPVEWTGGQLLRTAADVPAFRQSMGKADALLVFNLTSGCGSMLDPIVAMGYPTLLFSRPYAGHDWSGIGDRQRLGQHVEVISSSDLQDLAPFVPILDAIRRIKQTRILCLRSSLDKSENMLAMEKLFGMEIVLSDYARLNQLYQNADSLRAARLADDFIAHAVRMVEPTRQEVEKSMRLYLAIVELLRQENAEVITIDCLGGFQRSELPAYPCVAWTLLNDAGRVGVCEADWETTITQAIFQYLTGKPGFVSDPVIDTHTNTVIHAHCVSATKMDGPEGESAPYIIRSHMEDNRGVSVQVKMRVGQNITLAKLAGGKMRISTGTIRDNPENARGCRTKVTTEVTDADRLLHNYSGGLHRVLVYGDHVQAMKRMGRLVGFEVVEEI